MQTHVERSQLTPEKPPGGSPNQGRHAGRSQATRSIVYAQQTIGAQAMQPQPLPSAPDQTAGVSLASSKRFSHNFGQISLLSDRVDGQNARLKADNIRLLRVQTKLRLGTPGDRYEQEAERVADSVMQNRATPTTGGASFVQAEPQLSRISRLTQRATNLDDLEEEEESLQRMVIPGRGADVTSAVVQRAAEVDELEEEEESLQRKAVGGPQTEVAPDVARHIGARQGGGRSMDAATRAFMEPRFGLDFSNVRLHTDSRSGESARQLHARAYTVGNDIFFASGEFQPSSPRGKHLLAHELTHVVQQNGGGQVHRQVDNHAEVERVTATGPVVQRASVYDLVDNMSEDEAQVKIDGVMGAGWYDTWMTREAEYEVEMKRARTNRARFEQFEGSSNASVLYWDTERVRRAADYLREEMRKILTDQAVDTVRVDDINAVLSLSLSVLEGDNDVLDGTFAVGLATALIMVPWLLIVRGATLLEKRLETLKKALEKAEREETEAWIKGAIGFTITAVTLLAPQVGLVARLTMAAGQVGLDFMLEGPDQSLPKEIGGKTGPIAEQVADGIADIEKLAPGASKAAKGVSRGISGAGLYLNWSEISLASANVEELAALTKKTEKSHTYLLRLLKANKKQYMLFMLNFSKAQGRIEEAWDDVRETRYALYDEMKDTGFDP